MSETEISYCARLLRQQDPDRYLTALFAPAERREALFALYAFNLELARARESVREPIMGRMRLQWWRDCLPEIMAGQARREELNLLLDVANRIEGHTICALGDAAAWPVQSFLKHYRHEFEYMIDHGGRSIVESQARAA